MDSTILLYLDTSGKTGRVGLATFDRVLAQEILPDTQQQAAQINEAIARVCAAAQVGLNALSGVAIVAGPGSYTGLRVSMATAKGICYATNVPLLCFNIFELMGSKVLGQTNENVLLMALKARAQEYFLGGYNADGNAVIAPQHITLEALKEVLKSYSGEKLLTDDEELIEEYSFAEYNSDWNVELEFWLPIVKKKWEAQQFDDVAYAEPLYLKAAFTTQRKKNVL